MKNGKISPMSQSSLVTDKYREKDDKQFESVEKLDFYNELLLAVEKVKKETSIANPRYILFCPIHNNDINYCESCCDNQMKSVCLHHTEMLSQNRNIP